MSAPTFISFASKDHGVAETICAAVENRGFPCWISSRDIEPGENFQIAIVQAIRAAKTMILVFSANSNNSDEIKKELALASQSHLVVIPIRVEDVTPDEAFAYEFATRQWIDAFDDWE
jgi:TIR domain